MSQLLATRLGVAGIHLPPRASPAPPAAAVLIGHWALDELTGSSADDAHVRDNDGVYSNVILNQDPLVAGSAGRSVRFTGTSSVAIPHVVSGGFDEGFDEGFG